MEAHMTIETTAAAIGAKCTAICGVVLTLVGVANETMPLVKWFSFFFAGTASIISIWLGIRSLRKKR